MKFWSVAICLALLSLGCGESGDCEQTNPNYDPNDPNSEACLDGTLATGEEGGDSALPEGGVNVEGTEEALEEGDEGTADSGEESPSGEESATEEGAEGSGEESAEGAESPSEEGGEGTETPGEEGGEGTETPGEEGGEGTETPGEEGGEGGAAVDTAPVGTWLLWTESAPGCADEDLLSTRFTVAKYAVLSVAADGTATIVLHDESYLMFRTYVFPTLEQAADDTYIVSVDESVEEVEGSNCTINRKATISLTSSLGSWAGKLDYEEYKKGGGCYSDGCEGSLEVKTQELGEPINPLYWEGAFPFGYENEAEGVSEQGEMFFYSVPDQPYFFELDITTIPTSLSPIRGKKYVAGRSDKLWGKAVNLEFSACPDDYNLDVWDVTLTVDLGEAFGGNVERTTSTFNEACEETKTSTLGVFSAPAPPAAP